MEKITFKQLQNAGYKEFDAKQCLSGCQRAFQKKCTTQDGRKFFITFEWFSYDGMSVPSSVCKFGANSSFVRGENSVNLSFGCSGRTAEDVEAFAEEIFMKMDMESN